MIVFDIGANVGAHTFKISKLLESGTGKVYGFEPTTFAFGKLLKNKSLNPNLDNIILEKVGFSDVEDEFLIDEVGLCFRASWNIDSNVSRKLGDTIKLRKLDDYVRKEKINKIDFMKIDTDGYENKILCGGINIIRKWKPMILIEIGDSLHRVGDDLDSFFNEMKALDYAIETLDDQKIGYKELKRMCEIECQMVLFK